MFKRDPGKFFNFSAGREPEYVGDNPHSSTRRRGDPVGHLDTKTIRERQFGPFQSRISTQTTVVPSQAIHYYPQPTWPEQPPPYGDGRIASSYPSQGRVTLSTLCAVVEKCSMSLYTGALLPPTAPYPGLFCLQCKQWQCQCGRGVVSSPVSYHQSYGRSDETNSGLPGEEAGYQTHRLDGGATVAQGVRQFHQQGGTRGLFVIVSTSLKHCCLCIKNCIAQSVLYGHTRRLPLLLTKL